MDWRMPTQDEIEGLYDSSKKNRHGYSVTKVIDISASSPLASEPRGPGVARLVSDLNGWALSSHSVLYFYRALPVRSGN